MSDLSLSHEVQRLRDQLRARDLAVQRLESKFLAAEKSHQAQVTLLQQKLRRALVDKEALERELHKSTRQTRKLQRKEKVRVMHDEELSASSSSPSTTPVGQKRRLAATTTAPGDAQGEVVFAASPALKQSPRQRTARLGAPAERGRRRSARGHASTRGGRGQRPSRSTAPTRSASIPQPPKMARSASEQTKQSHSPRQRMRRISPSPAPVKASSHAMAGSSSTSPRTRRLKVPKNLTPPDTAELGRSVLERGRLLMSVVRNVSLNMTVASALPMLLKKAPAVLECAAVVVVMRDGTSQELTARAQFAPPFQHSSTMSYTVPPLHKSSSGALGRVFDTGRSVPLVDAATSPLFDSTFDGPGGFAVHNALYLPIFERNEGGTTTPRVIGVVQALNRRRGAFTVDDESLGNVLSTAMSSCVANDLAERVRRTKEAVVDVISEATLAANVSDAVRMIVQSCCAMVTAARATLFLLSADREHLIVHTASRNSSEAMPSGYQIPARSGIAAHVAQTGEVLNIRDAYEDSRFNSAVDRRTGFVTRSLLTVPVRNDAGVVIGALQAVNKTTALSTGDDAPPLPSGREHYFSDDDETVLALLAHQVGPVLRNVHAFHAHSSERARNAALITEMQRIAPPEAPRIEQAKDVYAALCTAAHRLIGADSVRVLLVNRHQQGEITVLGDLSEQRQESKLGRVTPRFKARPKTVVNRVLLTGEPGIAQRERLDAEELAELGDGNDGQTVRCVMLMPILRAAGELGSHTGGPPEIVAMLECVNKTSDLLSSLDPATRTLFGHLEDENHGVASSVRVRPLFTTEDLELMQCLVSQAGISLHRASVFSQLERVEQRRDALMQIVKTGAGSGSIDDMILQIVSLSYQIVPAERITLFLVDRIRKELWCKVSKDAAGFRIPMTAGVVGHVVTTGEVMNVPDAYQCQYFDQSFDKKTNFRTRSILCVPVKDSKGKVVAAIQAINKMESDGSYGVFGTEEHELLKAVEEEVATVLKHKQLEATFHRVMNSDEEHLKAFVAQYATNHDRKIERSGSTLSLTSSSSSVAALTPPRPSHVRAISLFTSTAATGERTSSQQSNNSSSSLQADIDEAAEDFGTEDTKEDHRGDRDSHPDHSDDSDDTDEEEEEESQRVTGSRASKRRPSVAASLTKRRELMARFSSMSKLSEEEEAAVCDPESRLVPVNVFASRVVALERVATWDFDPFMHNDNELEEVVYTMLHCFDLIEGMGVSPATTRSFVSAIRANYRDNPYHNFKHAFSTMHCAFMILTDAGRKPGSCGDLLTRPDVFTILIAALCHDVDHPGTNNTFAINSRDELAILYNDVSVLENHHASTTFRLMYQDGNNVLENLPMSTHMELRTSIIRAILATDIAGHFKVTTELQRMQTEMSSRNNETDEHERQLIVNCIVHASDISNPALPKHVAVKWAPLVGQEFNAQAARETELGLPVAPFMAKTGDLALAELNRNFINFICRPLWVTLADILPHLAVNVQHMDENLAHWNAVYDREHTELEPPQTTITVDDEDGEHADDVATKAPAKTLDTAEVIEDKVSEG